MTMGSGSSPDPNIYYRTKKDRQPKLPVFFLGSVGQNGDPVLGDYSDQVYEPGGKVANAGG